MESKEERASWPVITSLCALHSLDPSEMFTELYREEEGMRQVVRRIKGGIKRREIQPVSSSLSVLHCLGHTEIHRVG